jgi:lysophospholipase L1-like esterase
MKLAALFVAVLLVVLLGALKSRAAARPRIAMIGDSQAFLLQQRDALPAVLGSDFELKSFPAPGSSVISWSNGANAVDLRRALALHPDVVLVVLGTNDCCMGPRIIRNEAAMLRALLRKLAGVRVIWVLPPQLRRRCQEGVPSFVSMLRQAGVERIDSQAISIEMWDDGIHPSVKGRQAWARFIAGELRGRLQGSAGQP